MARLLRSIAFGVGGFALMTAFVLAVVFIKCLVLGVPFKLSVTLPPATRGSVSFGVVVAIFVFIILRPKAQGTD